MFAATFESVSRPATADDNSNLYWLGAESTTQQLPPGRFRVTLVLASPEAANWRIEPGEFRIVAPNGARAGMLGLLKIHRLILQNKEDDALAEADRLSAANADNGDAWTAKGDLLMSKDRPAEALKAYDRALGLSKKAGAEAVAINTRRHSAFLRSLEKRSVVKSPP